MHVSYLLNTLAFGLCASAAQVTYDKKYDKGDNPLSSVSCSDGLNGLMTKYKWKTFSQIPGFPFIGGGSLVTGWNSTGCGKCVALSFRGRTINIVLVDFVGTGFNIAEQAFSVLTDEQTKLGIIDAGASISEPRECGISETGAPIGGNNGGNNGGNTGSNNGGSNGNSGTNNGGNNGGNRGGNRGGNNGGNTGGNNGGNNGGSSCGVNGAGCTGGVGK